MGNPFFITGYPRSMTAWLSVALDCAHERDGKSMEEFMQDIECGEQSGDSSSIASMLYAEIKERFPDSRWVVIEREKDECLQSFCKVSKLPKNKCVELFDYIEHCISGISPALRVKFCDIQARLKEIWEWCYPEIDYPVKRIKKLQMLNIQQIPHLIQMGAGTI
jgi:hypothetical protein